MTSADPTPGEPTEHRLPSETTIKRLYATAFGCCKPGCGEELFRFNEATGEYLLNSRVAHIQARREGGPRCRVHLSHRGATNAGARQRVWCGQRTDDAPDGASFIFLAKRDGGFTAQVDQWLDQSPHAEGHQFLCHVSCFRASVPTSQQYALELALDLP